MARQVCKPVGAIQRSAQPLLLLRSGGGRRATTAKRACCPPCGSRGAHCLLMTGSGGVTRFGWCVDLAQQLIEMARALYNSSEACTAVRILMCVSWRCRELEAMRGGKYQPVP
eukprot:75475-Chlamydomonas_euryale.AAC.3